MRKYIVLLAGLVLMVFLTVAFTKMSVNETNRLNKGKTYKKTTSNQSSDVANHQNNSSNHSATLSADEMQQIVTQLTAVDPRIDEAAAYWLCDHYPTAAKAASKQEAGASPDERDAIWKADTGKRLPELLAERESN